jgi:hypothetical protein
MLEDVTGDDEVLRSVLELGQRLRVVDDYRVHERVRRILRLLAKRGWRLHVDVAGPRANWQVRRCSHGADLQSVAFDVEMSHQHPPDSKPTKAEETISQPQEGGNRARVSVLCPRYRELSDETHHDGRAYWTP